MTHSSISPRHPNRKAPTVRRSIVISLSTVAVLFALAGCSALPTSAGGAGTVEIGGDTMLLDVRTAEEYAAGHLDSAHLLDFNGGDLAAAIQSLDPDAEYLVYCRSGNRSSQAIALMEQAGFTNLTNLGSLEQASVATKLPIVN